MLELYSRQHIPQWFQKKLSDILSQPAPNSIMSRIIIRLFICSASAPVLLLKIKKKSTKSHTTKVSFSQTSCRKCSPFVLNMHLFHGKSFQFFELLFTIRLTCYNWIAYTLYLLCIWVYLPHSTCLTLSSLVCLRCRIFLSSPNIVFDFQISHSTLRNRSNLENSNRTCKILRDSSRRLTLPQIKEREAVKAICCTVLCLLVLTALIKTSKNSFAP